MSVGAFCGDAEGLGVAVDPDAAAVAGGGAIFEFRSVSSSSAQAVGPTSRRQLLLKNRYITRCRPCLHR
jgi:hypothetical protein